MRAPWVTVGLLLLAMAPLPATGAGADAACSPGGPAVTATSGAGDPELPSLVYAALKTGFRVVVAWETELPEIGRLRYALDGGVASTRSETAPRTTHVFVLDSLPIGRAFCFTPLHQDSSPATASQHAIVTRNAMNAHDGTGYTINFLALMNEGSDVPLVEGYMDEFAARMVDATDGHVRVGRFVMIVGDHEHPNAGYLTCAFVVVVPGICTQWYDVLFTNDAWPQGAASTFLDGIQDRNAAIWMNSYWQGGVVSLGDDVGSVLMHEVGHYAFGAVDLYGGTLNCWDPAESISIMGASRLATEFDDEVNRCPDEPSISGYAPSYPRLRARFPLVPDRHGVIDPGPVGVGPAYARHTFEILPPRVDVPIPPVPQVQQDDAGSGADAGSFPTSAVPIDADVLYEGQLLYPGDGSDMYRMDAPAGSTIEVAIYPRTATCFELRRADGSSIPGSCAYDGAGASRVATSTGEPIYVRFILGTGPSYRFGYGVDGPAPSLV